MSARTVVLAFGDLVAVFTTWPPQCVARARHRPRVRPDLPRGGPHRCTRLTMYGIPGAPEVVDVAGVRVEAIVVEGELGARLLAQRCFSHEADGVALVDPEWVPFDPQTHRGLIVEGER